MNKIESIIFDFGGVLGADANSWTKDDEVLFLTGLSAQKINALFQSHWDTLKLGKQDLQTFFEDVAKQSKHTVSIHQLRELYHKKITINEAVFALAKSLSPQYKLYVLANESLEGMAKKIDKFGLNDYFLKIFNSAELGVAKPDPQTYEAVLAAMQTRAEHVFFTDDREENVKAAQKIGIHSCLFENIEKLRLDISNVLSQVTSES